MSKEFEELKASIASDGTKTTFALPAEELAALARTQNEANTFHIPAEAKHMTEERIETAGVRWRLLKIQTGEESSPNGLYMIPGGGYVFTASEAHIKAGILYGRRSRRDVWIPIYPTLPDVTLDVLIAVLLEGYTRMEKAYGGEHLAVAGLSSGGHGAIALCALLNRKRKEAQEAGQPAETVPALPDRVFAMSPGLAPESEEERNAMFAVGDADIKLSTELIRTLELFTAGADPLAADPLQGSLKGLRSLYVTYGGEEFLRIEAENVRRVAERDGVDVLVEVVPEMFHCFQLNTAFPEGKNGQERLIAFLKWHTRG